MMLLPCSTSSTTFRPAALAQRAFAALERVFDQGRLEQVIVDTAEPRNALIFQAMLGIDPSGFHVAVSSAVAG